MKQKYFEIIEWLAVGLLVMLQFSITSELVSPTSLTYAILITISTGIIGLIAFFKNHYQIVIVEIAFILATWFPKIY